MQILGYFYAKRKENILFIWSIQKKAVLLQPQKANSLFIN